MRVQVTVGMELDRLPDATARELARELVEARGLTVSRVAIKAEADRVKAFVPKAGKPGSVVTDNQGIAYVVWAEADTGHNGRSTGYVWATRRDNPDGYYWRLKSRGFAEPYHANGRRHTFGAACAACLSEAVA